MTSTERWARRRHRHELRDRSESSSGCSRSSVGSRPEHEVCRVEHSNVSQLSGQAIDATTSIGGFLSDKVQDSFGEVVEPTIVKRGF